MQNNIVKIVRWEDGVIISSNAVGKRKVVFLPPEVQSERFTSPALKTRANAFKFARILTSRAEMLSKRRNAGNRQVYVYEANDACAIK